MCLFHIESKRLHVKSKLLVEVINKASKRRLQKTCMRFFNVLDFKKKTRLPASKQFSHENQIKEFLIRISPMVLLPYFEQVFLH